MIKSDFIILIMNCKKYVHKAEYQKKTWLKNVHIPYFHVLGNPSLNTEYEFDHCNKKLTVKTGDDYISLPQKVISAYNAVKEVYDFKYIFKTDDDQNLISDDFFHTFPIILQQQIPSPHYGGKIIHIKPHISTYYTIHPELPRDLYMQETSYSTGRFYFLSYDAVESLIKEKSNISKEYFEDYAIGLYLDPIFKDNALCIDTDRIFRDILVKELMDYVYIFTEIVRCGDIGVQAISSFHKYHDLPLNIWCSEEDVQSIPYHTNNIIHVIEKNSDVYKDFDEGHKGTSHLWTNLILDLPEKYTHLLHFDSDVLFLGNMCCTIMDNIPEYDLIGPIRNYIHNKNNRDDVRYLPDVVQTYCFAFNRTRVIEKNKHILWNWVRGFPVNFPHAVIDYFDPVSFSILKNGGKIKHIDKDVIGGADLLGCRNNKHAELNTLFDVGDKIIHFAGVGSGLNFYKMIIDDKKINVPDSYVKFGLERFDYYSQLFFNKRVLNSDVNDANVEKFKQLIHA